MEPISEERQRKVYEWLYPDTAPVTRFQKYEIVVDLGKRNASHLYLANGKPNYQFFFTEIVPRLKEAKVYIMYGNMGSDEWWMDAVNLPVDVITNPDPIAATAEYIEALEGR